MAAPQILQAVNIRMNKGTRIALTGDFDPLSTNVSAVQGFDGATPTFGFAWRVLYLDSQVLVVLVIGLFFPAFRLDKRRPAFSGNETLSITLTSSAPTTAQPPAVPVVFIDDDEACDEF
jgi:hypothetical protein